VLRLVGYWLGTVIVCLLLAMVLGWFADPLASSEQNWQRQSWLAGSLLVATLLMLPIGVLHLIRFTHRFAGPIIRLRNVLNDLADGKPVPELRFRKGDYWHDLADAFNRVRATRAAGEGHPARSLRENFEATCSIDKVEAEVVHV
jgi:hypothetical protein